MDNKTENSSDYRLTTRISFFNKNSGAPPFGSNSISVAFDARGNIAVLDIIGVGGGTPSAALNVSVAFIPNITVNDLVGKSVQVGGSGIYLFATLGIEGVFGIEDKKYRGIVISPGVSAIPMWLEYHGELTQTFMIGQINIYEMIERLKNE